MTRGCCSPPSRFRSPSPSSGTAGWPLAAAGRSWRGAGDPRALRPGRVTQGSRRAPVGIATAAAWRRWPCWRSTAAARRRRHRSRLARMVALRRRALGPARAGVALWPGARRPSALERGGDHPVRPRSMPARCRRSSFRSATARRRDRSLGRRLAGLLPAGGDLGLRQRGDVRRQADRRSQAGAHGEPGQDALGRGRRASSAALSWRRSSPCLVFPRVGVDVSPGGRWSSWRR